MAYIVLVAEPPEGATDEERLALALERIDLGVGIETAADWAGLSRSKFYRLKEQFAASGRVPRKPDVPATGRVVGLPASQSDVDALIRDMGEVIARHTVGAREPNASEAEGTPPQTNMNEDTKTEGATGGR
jgi:hypothetical protein